jgi:glycosyltransferase involved in cell wall biosynthesis
MMGVRLNLIGVSEWISNQCRRSQLFRTFPIETICNAIHPHRFFAVHRGEARRRLNIPQEARVVLFSVSGNTQDTRKGLDIAKQALRELGSADIFLLPMGIAHESSELKTALLFHKGLPARHVSDDAMLRDYYAAADVVWHPSRADTSSMVALEAFACGTPVIASTVGGVPEVIRSLGILIPPENPTALANATRSFFTDRAICSGLRDSLSNHSPMNDFERMITQHERYYDRIILKAQASLS